MNFKLLLIMAITTVLVACGGAEERKAVYLEKAKVSIAAGDLDKARIELKNVLQIDPKDTDAFYQLGMVYEQQQEYRKAYRHYLKVEELNPELLQNQARLGKFYLLLMNEQEKAQEKIDLILSKEPANADGLLLKATMMVRNGKVEDAIAIVEKITANDKDNEEAVAFLATLYMSEDKASDAVNLLKTALRSQPENAKLNNLLASFLVKTKDYKAAEVIYKRFLEKKPDSSSSYNRLAAFYNISGDQAKAEATLRAAIENDPDDVDRQLALVRYLSKEKGNKVAINELKALIKNNASLGKLRTGLAELLYLDGNKEEAITVSKGAIRDFPEEGTGVQARIFLASVYMEQKDNDSAKAIIDEVITISPNDPKANFIKAKLAILDKDIESAIIALRIVTKETPENMDAYFLLVGVYGFEGNEEQVKATLNSAYDNNKTNADALLKLAKYYSNKDLAMSEKILDHYNLLKDKDYEGLLLKATILNQNKKVSEAYDMAKDLMSSHSDKPGGYIQAVPYLLQQEDKSEVVSVLEKGYRNTKDNRKILAILTSVQVTEKKFDVVEQRIKAELQSSPDDPELNLMLAKVYLVKKENDTATSILKKLVKSHSNIEEPYLLLSQIYLADNDNASAEAIVQEGKTNIAASKKIPLRLATLYELSGKHTEAMGVYRELYEANPDNLLVANNLASMLSDYGNGKEDLDLAGNLADKLEKTNQPVFLDTVGWVRYKQGDFQAAIKYLSQVVEKAPEINVFNYHLGMAYKKAGDSGNARKYLEKSLADKKEFKERSLAEAALKSI